MTGAIQNSRDCLYSNKKSNEEAWWGGVGYRNTLLEAWEEEWMRNCQKTDQEGENDWTVRKD